MESKQLPECPSQLYWTIAPGDTFWSIAEAYGTTVEELVRLNPTLDPLNLQPGTNICLPD